MSVSVKETAPPAVALAAQQHGALLESLSRVLPPGLARRVLAAGDADRRRIERDLHDGVQQRLTELRIRLALAAESFQQRGDTDASAVLNRFGQEVEQVIEEVRAFARGVYPPLLASQGLGVALVSASRYASAPITVSARAIRRCRPRSRARSTSRASRRSTMQPSTPDRRRFPSMPGIPPKRCISRSATRAGGLTPTGRRAEPD